MSDDLIERLRSAVGDARLVKLCRDAADALAAVEQERDHWHRVAMQAAEQERDAARVWHEKAHTFLEERNAYRARLAEVEKERDELHEKLEDTWTYAEALDITEARCREVERERDAARAAFERFSDWIPADMAGRIGIAAEWCALADLMRPALSPDRQTPEGGE